MRLQNSPPAGAGQVKRGTKTDALLAHIEGLGTDKTSFLPIGIRTTELAEATGVPAASISVLLLPHIKSGRIQMCKINAPGRPSQNEYRKGIGVAAPDFTPLNTKRACIAIGAPTKPLPVTTPAPAVSTARPDAPSTPRTSVLLAATPKPPKPGVGQNPGSRRMDSSLNTPARAPADTSRAETPGLDAGAALKKEPATRKAPAGDVLLLSIDQDGALQIGYGDDPARWVFEPRHVLTLGDFLHGTQGVWRP